MSMAGCSPAWWHVWCTVCHGCEHGKACQTAVERSPAGRPAPGPPARRPPFHRGAPGPARPAAARLPPLPQRAPRRELGAPGQRVLLDKQSNALHGETSLRLGELHYRMPHAATCRACAAVSLTVCGILALHNQARALQQLPRVHSRQRACLASSARSSASAAAKRCSAAASTSSSASVRASNT